MGRLGPLKRRDFVRKLRSLGFEGPSAGGRHELMTYGDYALPIPSDAEYTVSKHREMLREVSVIIGRDISREEWNSL